jgi:solute:Na+ symporter, SSS family
MIFFKLFNGEYTFGFMIAFALYNLFFISGNWAYVQRYTSVPTKKDAKKVGFLFGSLYIISPAIWMLPPMIYKIYNPGLTDFGEEGAYLMMCKEVLPLGMLGLMLGGMIFATSSSVNTTLNIAAGVFTNDLYKNLKPGVSNRHLMIVARTATIVFGLLTIVVALFVKNMGGIVEVVLSVGAITGGALYLPPLWALFSKRQTGKNILSATLVSLAVNLFFKFVSPALLNITLTRGQEMILGVVAPIVVLAFFELKNSISKKKNFDYIRYEKITSALKEKEKTEPKTDSTAQNTQGRKVISLGITGTGVLISVIGSLTSTGQLLVIMTGLSIIVLGLFIFPSKIFKK